MKMKLVIEQFPIDKLEFMKSELEIYAKCTVQQFGTDVIIICEADVVKYMEVLAVADKFDFNHPSSPTT